MEREKKKLKTRNEVTGLTPRDVPEPSDGRKKYEGNARRERATRRAKEDSRKAQEEKKKTKMTYRSSSEKEEEKTKKEIRLANVTNGSNAEKSGRVKRSTS